jgi:Pyridoxamine 5'-phosphate oxidase
MLDRGELLSFMRSSPLAVEASVSAEGGPQAAVVGIAVTGDFEVVFDTTDQTRKLANLRRNPKIALVIGPIGEERTVQYEGVVDEPTGAELERLKEAYFGVFPDGPERQSWPGITYMRARPTWIRYTDFRSDPPEITEFDVGSLRERIA